MQAMNVVRTQQMYSIASAPWCLGAPMDDPKALRVCWRSVGRWTLRSEPESAKRSSLSCLSAGTSGQSTHPWSLHTARTSPLTVTGWVPRPGIVRGTEPVRSCSVVLLLLHSVLKAATKASPGSKEGEISSASSQREARFWGRLQRTGSILVSVKDNLSQI